MDKKLQRIKHIVDSSNLAVNLGAAQVDQAIFTAADSVSTIVPTNFLTGAKCRALYMELNIHNAAATGAGVAPSVYDWMIWKKTAFGGTPAVLTVGTSDLKSYVFKQGMVMVAPQTSSRVYGLVRIPKLYWRYGRNDALMISIQNRVANGVNDNWCYKIIFKEIRG